MLSEMAGFGRIIDMSFDGSGDITAVTLDQEVQARRDDYVEDVTNLEEVEDVALLGSRTGVAIRRSNGSFQVAETSNATGVTDTLTLASPVSPANVGVDALVSVGRLNNEYRRLIVFGMQPRDDLVFEITMVDEAPSLWT